MVRKISLSVSRCSWLSAGARRSRGVEYAERGSAAGGTCGHRNVRGIRQILNWHPDPKKTYTPRDLLADPTWEQGFALLRKYGLSFDLQIYPGQMQAAAQLASRHPDTLIILNHTGMPVDRDAAGLQAWRAGMQALAQQPNVVAKISGLAMLDWQWTRRACGLRAPDARAFRA